MSNLNVKAAFIYRRLCRFSQAINCRDLLVVMLFKTNLQRERERERERERRSLE